MTSWELDERAAKSILLLKVDLFSTIHNNKLNMQGEKLDISAKFGVLVLHIPLLPLVKAAMYEIRVFVSRTLRP